MPRKADKIRPNQTGIVMTAVPTFRSSVYIDHDEGSTVSCDVLIELSLSSTRPERAGNNQTIDTLPSLQIARLCFLPLWSRLQRKACKTNTKPARITGNAQLGG
jgi:hypothetical protein